jgi:hypothetical protein
LRGFFSNLSLFVLFGAGSPSTLSRFRFGVVESIDGTIRVEVRSAFAFESGIYLA